MLPADNVTVPPGQKLDFFWSEIAGAALYQLEITGESDNTILTALLQPPTTNYRAFLAERKIAERDTAMAHRFARSARK